MDIRLKVKIFPSLFIMSNPLLILILILLSGIVFMIFISKGSLEYIDFSLLWLD